MQRFPRSMSAFFTSKRRPTNGKLSLTDEQIRLHGALWPRVQVATHREPPPRQHGKKVAPGLIDSGATPEAAARNAWARKGRSASRLQSILLSSTAKTVYVRSFGEPLVWSRDTQSGRMRMSSITHAKPGHSQDRRFTPSAAPQVPLGWHHDSAWTPFTLVRTGYASDGHLFLTSGHCLR